MAGGLTKGPSHAKGGIKMNVKSTGQNIEVEGGEGIINKHVMSSKKKISYKGKKATPCEIASDLNQQTGNGVKFDCAETEFTDMTPTDPSTGFDKGGEITEIIHEQTTPHSLEIDAIEEIADVSLLAKGGKTKESVGDKIKILMDEGYPHRQAVAIALSMKERGKYNMGGQVRTGGDCYERAGKMEVNASNKLDIRNCDYKPMMEAENIEVKDGFIHPTGKFYLVQAQVQHQALDDIVFGHSFLEDDEYVYDFSNGVCKVLPKSVYYYLGRIKTKKPYYYKYTPEQAIRKMIDTGHYGSWDLKTDSGL